VKATWTARRKVCSPVPTHQQADRTASYGNLFFDGARDAEEMLPAVSHTTHAVVALSLGEAGGWQDLRIE
jgi:hypothetical protein